MTTEELNAIIAKAEAGDVAAMNEVANVYANDANLKDVNKAFYWYNKSAETGDMLGMSNLGGWCYAYGNGVQIDLEKALYWLTRAAKECNNAWSATRLNTIGVELQYGNNGRTIDLPLAFKFYESAAETGDFNGMANAGYCASNGIGIEKDVNIAYKYFKQAAELGHWVAMSNLGGWCYLYGNGVEKDVDKAIHWLTRAAEEGNNIWSMNKLTYIFGELDGYINQEQAAKWFLELIKRDCDPNSGVYEKTGYNKDLYEKIKNAVQNSTTEEEMMSSLSSGDGGSLLGGAMSFTTSNAKTYINQAEAAIQRNIEYKEELHRKAEEEAARKREEEERARREAEERARREWESKERARQEAQARVKLIEQIETDYKDFCETPVKFTGSTFYVPDGVKRIGDYALEKCHAEKIVIPETVTSIGKNAFRELSRLKSVHIPNSVTRIGEYAFCSCESLTSIDIPSSITNIEEATFSGLGLTEIKIPNGVTHIGNWAFSHCQNLKTLELPDSLISMGDCAIDGCYQLETIITPNGIKSMVIEKIEEADLMKMPMIVEK